MAWIESHQSLAKHRKTLAAVALLRTDRHKFLGHLHELWWWGLDNADPSGFVREPAAVLGHAAGWPPKDAERFVHALTAAGFVEVVEGGFILHNWYDYAGKLNDQRELRRAANRRAQSARRQRLRGADEADNQQPTQPDPTGPYLTTPDDPPTPPSDGGTRGPRRRRRDDLGEYAVVQVAPEDDLACAEHGGHYEPKCERCLTNVRGYLEAKRRGVPQGVTS